MTPDRSRAEDTVPLQRVDTALTRAERRRRVDKQLRRLRRQFAFLFFLLILSMIVLSISQQINSNRIEYERYDLCVQRQAEITAYNAQNLGRVPPFPVASCGDDPRTD